MIHTTTSVYRQKGYTLIELLLYISIVGVLLAGVSVFFGTATDARVKNQSVAEVEQQGLAAMEYILQTIRNADAITAPATGATTSSLTVTVPTAALSPTIFSLSGGTPNALQVKEGAAAQIPLTNSLVQVSGLTFKNLSRASTPGVVQISFTIDRVNAANRNQYDYQKTFTATMAIRP